VVFVDLLRFVAALQMLQGHTIAALLAPEARHGAGYAVWATARGLTSVAFLFAAGLSFQLATGARGAPSGVRRRVVRAVRLVGLGYLLHLPVGLSSSDEATRAGALHEFVAVDVLQCIGVSMLLLEALRTLVESSRIRVLIASAFAIGLFALAPFAGELRASGSLRPLLAYFTSSGGSLFPLTPWAAHVFAGYATGSLVRPEVAPAAGPWAFLGTRLSVLGLALGAFAVLVAAIGAPRVLVDHASRLAGVLGLAWTLWLVGEHIRRVPRTVATLAQHTLVLYVFHVILVYGQGVGLADWIGPRLSVAGAVTAAVFVIAASAAIALGYDRLAAARRTG
jgi:hypothetical protein